MCFNWELDLLGLYAFLFVRLLRLTYSNVVFNVVVQAGLNLVHHAWAYPDAEYGKRTGASASMGIFVYDEYAGVTPTT